MHIASGDLWAGAEVQLYTLASQQQRSADTRVSVVLLNPGRLQQALQARGINVIVVDENQHHAGSIFMQLLRILHKHRPDIVHTHRIKENILGGFAAWLRGIPSVRTVHGASEHRPKWSQPHKQVQKFLDWFSGRFVQKAIIAVSSELAGKLATSFPHSHIKVIENGINIESTLNASQQATTQDATNDNNQFSVGIVGRLVEVKRIDLFIDIANIIADSHPNKAIQFKIYGDGPLLDEMQSYATRLIDSGQLQFMGHCDNIQQKLRKLDALLITSDHEGLPMVLLEAMCLKTCVIAHAVGAIPEVLDHGRCGILIPNQQPEDYAEALLSIEQNRKQLASLTENAFERVSRHYNAASNADAIAGLYRQYAN